MDQRMAVVYSVQTGTPLDDSPLALATIEYAAYIQHGRLRSPRAARRTCAVFLLLTLFMVILNLSGGHVRSGLAFAGLGAFWILAYRNAEGRQERRLRNAQVVEANARSQLG
jgi:hypothetical protein